jgi:hypothetical protein
MHIFLCDFNFNSYMSNLEVGVGCRTFVIFKNDF